MFDGTSLRCGRYRLKLDRPLVMGILNATPDSFSDGGAHMAFDRALRQAERMLVDGVDMIDIGGESSRPGAAPVSLEQELERVLPLVEALRDCGVPLSVDTYKPQTMRAVLAAGADMVNDIWALRMPDAIDAVSDSDCALCLMHMQRDPQTMQFDPRYDDVVAEVDNFLEARLSALDDAGIARERLVIDPGFGFGKRAEHNLALLNHLPALSRHRVPVLAGFSRKQTLGEITGRAVGDRMVASVAAALIAAERGARLIRVHDVAETVDALRVWQACRLESADAWGAGAAM